MQTILDTRISQIYALSYDNHALLDLCVDEVRPKLIPKPPCKVYGKIHKQPRNVGFFTDAVQGFKYAGQIAQAQPMTAELHALLDDVNRIFNAKFNTILVNEYENGLDKVDAHQDNQKQVDKEAGVVALSWGAVRNFRIRDKKTNEILKNIPTVPYEFLQMKGACQEELTHAIPRQKRVKEARISFTFRILK